MGGEVAREVGHHFGGRVLSEAMNYNAVRDRLLALAR